MLDWKKYYDAYPVNSELIWLNNCGTTPVNLWTQQRLQEYWQGYGQKGVFTEVATFPGVRKRIIDSLSSLLHCKASELALIHNTSEGLSLVASGLSYEQGDTVLILENEYPSNVYPWKYQKHRGARLEFVSPGEHPDEFVGNLKQKIAESGRIKVLSLSAVHWCSGMPFPLEKISNICQEQQIKLVIDGAQGVGHIHMDLQKIRIDYMAFSAWKWLLGPLGLGVLYIREGQEDELAPVIIGQNSVQDGEVYLPYKEELRPGATRYEYSTPNFADWVYFESVLSMLDEIGHQVVQNRIYELNDYLSDSLSALGMQVFAHKAWGVPTGITTFNKPDTDSKVITDALKRNGVICALRLGKIRLAPHIYNSKEQMDKVCEILQDI
ncbi:MAG: aminotransferase class V-fold PLP-dependent enzyme [Spirochaetota bacterium]